MKHLFKNFLLDKKIYRRNERYYQTMLSELLAQEAKPFYQTAFSNGERFLNGNPIFSTVYQDRIVRIIQKPPSLEPTLRVRLDQFDNLDELVISLELTDRFSPLVRHLAKKWLIERLSKNDMLILIQNILNPPWNRITPKKIGVGTPKTLIVKSKNYKIKPAHSSEVNEVEKSRRYRANRLGLSHKKEINQQKPLEEHPPRTRKKKIEEIVDVQKKSKK